MLFGIIALQALALTSAARTRVMSKITSEGVCKKKYALMKGQFCHEPSQYLIENIGGNPWEDLKCIQEWCETNEGGNRDGKCCKTYYAIIDPNPNGFGFGSVHLRGAKPEVQEKFKTAFGLQIEAAEAITEQTGPRAWEIEAAQRKAKPAPKVDTEESGAKCWCKNQHNGYAAYPKSRTNMVGPTGPCRDEDPCNTCSWRHKGSWGTAMYECCPVKDDGTKGGPCGGLKMPTFDGTHKCMCGGTTVLKSQIWTDSNTGCLPETRCADCRRDCVDSR